MYQYNDYELLYLIYENDDTALDIMYQKYIPLIKTRIKGFRIKKWNYEDFFQEGLLALNKAIQTYNPMARKTFNKYFDLILQRKFIQILRKESSHFYNVELVENGDYLMETNNLRDIYEYENDIINRCHFSDFELNVLQFMKKGLKSKDISLALECNVKQVYDASDRIKKKIKGVKNSLDNNSQFC